MAHTDNNQDESPQMNLNCSFLGSMNLFLLVAGAFGFFLNIFPCVVCYAKLRTRCGRTSRDVLLMSLVSVDFLTVCIPIPIYLSLYNNCAGTQRSNYIERPAICEILHLMFVWLKLASLFIITTLNYTSYLAMTARGIYRSIGDRISSSLACSRHEHKHRESSRNSSLVIVNLVVGIAIVALLIASLPYIGLGPDGKTLTQLYSSTKLSGGNVTTLFCSLEQISYPTQNSDYTFLFALLMSSSACLLLQIVHNVLSCFNCSSYSLDDASAIRSSKSFALYSRRLGAERDFAKMICVLGLTFHATWIPVMVAVGCIMSGHHISAEVFQYVIAAAFLSPSLNPVFFAAFLQEFRDGYMAVFQFICDKMFRLCKDCFKPQSKLDEVMTTSATSSMLAGNRAQV